MIDAGVENLDTKFDKLFLRSDHRLDPTDPTQISKNGIELPTAPFKVPFARDANNFINREKYIIQIAEGLKKHRRFALYGLGGTG